MRTKVVVPQRIADKLWALGAGAQPPRKLADDEVVIELDEEVLSKAIDLFDDERFEDGLERLIDARLLD